MEYKTKIQSVTINVSPSTKFRTTKGGKRILIGEPSYNLSVILKIEPIDLRNRELVFIGDLPFMYSTDGTLRNAYINSESTLAFNTADEITLKHTYTVRGEGS